MPEQSIQMNLFDYFKDNESFTTNPQEPHVFRQWECSVTSKKLLDFENDKLKDAIIRNVPLLRNKMKEIKEKRDKSKNYIIKDKSIAKLNKGDKCEK